MGVSHIEVLELLKKIGRGEAIPELRNPEKTWDYAYCGEVEYLVNGWELVVFNDCNDFDYVDLVVSPDGHKGEYDDWGLENEPGNLLNYEDEECFRKMVEILKNCK